ncbi:hypothetical protein P280DRAFT_468204 [Massarina eburnea CBS 473.64]|uniref:Glycosyltransferase family 69 protein n=1 Tax=Massarina eburnea CBS 473.64 TaxID=1395130 RepID=A0A6A6S4M6_9PLEO|nr:hypothetical protein P280DRAFT_468204 [Massarina eburnea CBS 473.64]
MLRRNQQRLLRHPAVRILLSILLIWDTLHILHIHYQQTSNFHSVAAPRNTKRIYIAAQHWNSAHLLRDRWNDALIALVKDLGMSNVFVSIYESGSYDDTKGALRELDLALGDLGVERKIVMSEVSHMDEIAKQPGEGWAKIPTGEMALRRIPFLAKLRNQVLFTLEALVKEGKEFDTVLFLNDVLFTPEDVLKLLNTNEGNYAAACSIDFTKPPEFYDTFALRDSAGHEALMQTYPYFRSSHSRYAAQRHLPVPVASCWNGMVAMPASPFLAENPLRFRSISDSLAAYHVEGSECCLIHADNYWSSKKGVWLNPNVRVGYNGTSFDAVRSMPEMSVGDVYKGVWRNRLLRWTTSAVFKEWVVGSRIKEWRKTHRLEEEAGSFCLVNEMQVIHEKGWRHV